MADEEVPPAVRRGSRSSQVQGQASRTSGRGSVVSFGGEEIVFEGPPSASARASEALSATAPAALGRGEAGAQPSRAMPMSDSMWMDDVMGALDRKTEELDDMRRMLEEAHQREAEVRAQAAAAGADLPPAQEASPSSGSTTRPSAEGKGPEYLDREAEQLLSQPQGRLTVSAIVMHLRSRLKVLAQTQYGASWKKLFKAQDTDGSGTLGWDEFLTVCRNLLGKDIKESHVRILYRSMDYDRSGDISLEEMSAFLEDPVERMRVRLRTTVHQKYSDNPRSLFKAADKDGSGGLDWDEFRRLVRTDFKLIDDDVQLTTVFRALDSDGSGSVCVEEFAAFVADEGQLINVPLRVTLVGARDLVNSAAVKGLTNGNRKRIDPYCVCEIAGRPAKFNQRFQSKAVNGRTDPEWKHPGDLPDYNLGESLLFSVWHRNHMSKDVLLGRVKLPSSSFVEKGFQGDVQLVETGSKIKSYVNVKVEKLGSVRHSFALKTATTMAIPGMGSARDAGEDDLDDSGAERSANGGGRPGDPSRLARLEMENAALQKELAKLREAIAHPGSGLANEAVREEVAKMLKELKATKKALSKAEQGMSVATQERKTLERVAKDAIKQKVREVKEEAARASATLRAQLFQATERGAAMERTLMDNHLPVPEVQGDEEERELRRELARLRQVVAQLQAHGGGHSPAPPSSAEGHEFCQEKEEALLGASNRAFGEATAAKAQVAELEGEVATLRQRTAPQDAPWLRFTPAKLNVQRCFARTWSNGLGGQCSRRKTAGLEYCEEHQTEESRAEFGTVDGPIPAKKFQQFERHASRNGSST